MSVSPLGVSWDKIHKDLPQISGYSYYYGELDWGKVSYLGSADILGMETEIQLVFHANKISKAYLILGPGGINDWNCIDKYKEVRTMLNHKYGPYNYVKESKDPITDDLLSAAPCYPISLGLHDVHTYWTYENYQIESSLFGGDGETFYIEVTYVYRSRDKNRNKKEIQQIIKGF